MVLKHWQVEGSSLSVRCVGVAISQRLKKRKKMADYLHRTATTTYPCYLPVLGEFSRSWSCKTCRCKDT
jgi:hypothetical protein